MTWQLILIINDAVAVLDFNLTMADCAARLTDFAEFAIAANGDLFCEQQTKEGY